MSKLPINYTLGKIEIYASGGGFYHAQQPIELIDYNGYTGYAYLFITIPDWAEELQLVIPDPEDPSNPYLYEEGYLGEFYKEDLKNTPFASIYLNLLQALSEDLGENQEVWLDEALPNYGSDKLTLREFIEYLSNYFSITAGRKITSSTELVEYTVEGFYSAHLYGLAASETVTNFSEALDIAWDYASSGLYIRITNENTGEWEAYNPDDWADAIEYGDVPTSVYNLV